jgi:hypothetical protein
MSARRFLRKITHPTVRQPRYVFDALHVAEFYFYFRLRGLGGTFLVQSYASWWSFLPSTLRGTVRKS